MAGSGLPVVVGKYSPASTHSPPCSLTPSLTCSMAGSGLPVDPDVSASVLGAVCESGAWAKAVALVQAVQVRD
jgi:hypothetical protein